PAEELARRLRAAVAPESAACPADGARRDRPDRDRLAAAINRCLGPARPGPCRQLDAALVHEAVEALRRTVPLWADEPLGTAARRLWEYLYLCLPLTALAAVTGAPETAPPLDGTSPCPA
ncbi:hypothetical protein ACWGB8_37280, partial [Kitasatospora sp. NPDC054939]